MLLMDDGEVATPLAGCLLCELGKVPLDHPEAFFGLIAVHVDANAVVLLEPSELGVIVAPSQHVRDLSKVPGCSPGSFLAALRRVALCVGSVFGCSGATIGHLEPGLLNCEGHVAFEVIPTSAEESRRPTGATDVMLQAELLATGLR